MDTAEKSLVAKEIFGKGGAGLGRLADASAAAGGIDKLAASLNQLDILTSAETKRFDDLGDAIKENFKLASQNVTSSFAGPVLDVLKSVSEVLLDLSRIVKLVVTPLADAFAGPVLEALTTFKERLDGVIEAMQNVGDADKFRVLLEEFIPPQLLDTISALIDLLKILITVIGNVNAGLINLATFNFSGALANAQAGLAAVSNFGTAISNFRRALADNAAATGSSAGLPSINVIAKQSDEGGT